MPIHTMHIKALSHKDIHDPEMAQFVWAKTNLKDT